MIKGLSHGFWVPMNEYDPDWSKRGSERIRKTRDTCHDVGDERIFHCSECGFGLSDVYLSDEDYLWDDDGERVEPWPPFCPNCGRRVVQP